MNFIKKTVKPNGRTHIYCCGIKIGSYRSEKVRKIADDDRLLKIYGQEFMDIYHAVRPYTMITEEAAFLNYQCINYLEDNNIPGDIVECGVWRGGSCMLMALTLLKRGNTSRKIYMYDTFEGMSEPTSEDVNVYNNVAQSWLQEQKRTNNYIHGDTGWCQATIEDVENNMKKTQYPLNNIMFVKGKVEQTIPDTLPEKIALLRLDTDWYESTKHEMGYLYPQLVNDGVVLLDDYYYWIGSRKAVDEYLLKCSPKPFLVKAGTAALIINNRHEAK